MEILHLSDWHCNAEKANRKLLAEQHRWHKPDLLLLTGDMIPNLRAPWHPFFLQSEERKRQRGLWLKWVTMLAHHFPGVPVVAVPGNHDFCDYGWDGEVISFDEHAVPSVVTVAGLKIGGFRGVEYLSGYWDGEMGPNEMAHTVSLLDPDIDVLVTHCPPHNILDEVEPGHCVGPKPLEEFVKANSRLKLHAFGHIHECGGRVQEINGVKYSNASMSLNVILL